MGKIIDLTGQKFGRLLVLGLGDIHMSPSGKRRYAWKCRCDCGKEVEVLAQSLKSGHTQSCGCYAIEQSRERKGKTIHRRNKAEICGDYVVMYTSNGEPFYVDTEDYDRVKDIGWWKDHAGYIIGQKNGKELKMHRVIMDCPDGMEVDHIHGNMTRNDNRKSNLRIVTKSENGRNKGLLPTNKSGVTGVSWNKQNNKWEAYITHLGHHHFLGFSDTIEGAAKLRKQAEEKYFGEYAYSASQEKGDPESISSSETENQSRISMAV